MQGLAVLLFPAVLMLFALAMEKMEAQIGEVSVNQDQVEEFLDGAAPEQVDTLVKDGFTAALDEFRSRRDAEQSEFSDSSGQASKAS